MCWAFGTLAFLEINQGLQSESVLSDPAIGKQGNAVSPVAENQRECGRGKRLRMRVKGRG